MFAACGDDGDDTATTGTSTTAAPTTTAGADDHQGRSDDHDRRHRPAAFAAGTPEAAAATAYTTVFDSNVDFDAKTAHLADAAALADDHRRLLRGGAAVRGHQADADGGRRSPATPRR